VLAGCGEAARPEAAPTVLVIGRSPPQDAASPSADEPLPPSRPVNDAETEIVAIEPLPSQGGTSVGPLSPGCPPFDRGAAAAALGGVNLQKCKQLGGPAGSGHVKITYATSGQVQSAVIDGGAFPGTPAGGCIALQFRNARVPAFCGAVVTVGKSFSLH
jgi:hypothetical protein